MKNILPFLALCAVLSGCATKQSASSSTASCASHEPAFNGLETHLGNLSRLADVQTRSLSPENFTGEKGKGGMATNGFGANAARELGRGWKISPAVKIPAGTNWTLGEIKGPGSIQQIWMTPTGNWRKTILRIYWDGEKTPSVECPIGDFFASGLGGYAQINSLAVCVNPGSAFNCYWQMPFRKSARITIENTDAQDMLLFYQVNYALGKVPDDAAYFHAQFRRKNLKDEKGLYTILDGVKGKGHYVGTYMTWQVNSPGWWGEGEIKFFMDGDKEFPTLCGTGTEDYFCGSYNFDVGGRYVAFSTPYAGMPKVEPPDKAYEVGQKFSLYRWHINDPIRFENDLRVTIQALGWQSEGRYLLLGDKLSSVAFWYQTEPHNPFPHMPGSGKR